MHVRAEDRRTVEDRTSEEAQELEEQVLLLRGDFVPAEALPASLNLVFGDTLLDIGVEQLLRDVAGIFAGAGFLGALLPELRLKSTSDASQVSAADENEIRTCHAFFGFSSPLPAAASSC